MQLNRSLCHLCQEVPYPRTIFPYCDSCIALQRSPCFPRFEEILRSKLELVISYYEAELKKVAASATEKKQTQISSVLETTLDSSRKSNELLVKLLQEKVDRCIAENAELKQVLAKLQAHSLSNSNNNHTIEGSPDIEPGQAH